MNISGLAVLEKVDFRGGLGFGRCIGQDGVPVRVRPKGVRKKSERNPEGKPKAYMKK
jgi:hypothetical protein